jgi:CHAT domain-containing protein/Tfp pilus assembly protein PilF
MNAWLQLGLLALAGAAAPPAKEVGFRDDFTGQSRPLYSTRGGVTWTRGAVRLEQGARLARPLPLGHRAELRALVRLPARGGELELRFEGEGINAVLALRGAGGKVELVNREKPEQVVSLGQGADWQVRAEVRHGVLRCKAWAQGKPEPDKWQSVRYAGWDWRDLARLAVRAGKGGGTLRRLEVAGVRPDEPRVSPEQEASLAKYATALLQSEALLRQGKREEAARKSREALAGCEKVLGRDHPVVLTMLAGEAGRWSKAASFALAGELAEAAVTRCVKVYGNEHPQTALAYNVRGLVAYSAGAHVKARRDYERALAMRRALFGPNHEATATTLDNLGVLHSQLGRYELALKCQQQALAAYRQTLGRQHTETLACASNLAGTLMDLDRLKEARQLLEETVALARQHHAGEGVTLLVQNTLANVHVRSGDDRAAREVLEETLPAARKLYGLRHPMTLQMMNNLAVTLMRLKDNASARPLLEQVLAEKRQLFPPGHVDIAVTASNLAALLGELGHWKKARDLLAEAVAIRRRVRGEKDPLTLRLTWHYAHALHALGELAAAQKLYEAILPVLEKGPDRLEEARVLNNLAFVLRGQKEDPVRARRYFERSHALLLKQLGPRHSETVLAVQNEASALLRVELYAEAEELLIKALADIRKAFGEDHYFTAKSLLNLGWARLNLGKEAQARQHYAAGLAILEKTRPEWLKKELPFEPPLPHTLATTYSHLGLWEMDQKKYDAACKHLRRALELTTKCYGPHSIEVAKRRGNLGSALARMGKEEDSLRELEAAAAVSEKALGADHPDVAVARHNLGMLLARQGKFYRAWRELLVGAEILARQVRLDSAGLAQREHGSRDRTLRPACAVVLSLAEKRPKLSAEQSRQLLGLVLEQKGISSAAVLGRREALAVGNDPTAKARLEQLNQARQLRADLLLQGPGPLPAARHHATLETLRKREDRLERALAEAVAAYARQRQSQRAGAAELAGRLPKAAALIEFVRFGYWDWSGESWDADHHPRYAALVLLPGAKAAEVHYVSLGKAAKVDAAVRAWRAAVVKGRIDRKAEDELRRRVWEPVAKVLPKGTQRLYLAPDAELALVPFESIRLDDRSYLIERYAVSYLGSGRDLMGPPAKAGNGPDLILADPDYDDLPEAKKTARSSTVVSAANEMRGLGLEKKARFTRLPGTAREAQAVAKLLRAKPGRRVVVKTGKAASEETLREVNRPRLLLLSTHGFFLGDVRSTGDDLPQRGLGLVAQEKPGLVLPRVQGDARLRSGLALAGANRWQERTKRGHSDGLLTAYEVEGLDLWGTDLVVLSACETGLGQVDVGEGVIGLRRAFQLAGARTVVSSLWKVPDQETEALMTRFLALWLQDKPKAEALRLAQRELLARLRKSSEARHKDAPPLFWAGFICHGAAE